MSKHIEPEVEDWRSAGSSMEPTPCYSVDVVQDLGTVVDDSEREPLREVFQMIGEHFAEAATSGSDHFEYRITHHSVNHSHEILVTVTDPPLDQLREAAEA